MHIKIAITGASCTGKTTLAHELMRDTRINHVITSVINVDARTILKQLGFQSMDLMNREELKSFQLNYYEKKKQIEKGLNDFLAERSFVDVAAFWLIRDTFEQGIDEQNRLIIPCQTESQKYDLHIFLPFGIIPFESDGYRSEDIELHTKVSAQMKSFLVEWNLMFVEIDTDDLHLRVDQVVTEILALVNQK